MKKGVVVVDALVNVGFIAISVLLLATQLPAMSNDIRTVLDKESVNNQAKTVAGLLSIAYNSPGSITLSHEFPEGKDYKVTVKTSGYVEVCAENACSESKAFLRIDKEFSEEDIKFLVISKESGKATLHLSKSDTAPSIGIPKSGTCELGSGECSPEKLRAVFGSAAEAASQICQKESGGNTRALNDACLRGTSADYSVGLFQTNLLDRCPAGITWNHDYSNPRCQIVDQNALERCKQDYGYGNAEVNMQKAYEISSGGTNWCPWKTNANNCGLGPC
ncbi:MAG: hypothetical protein HYT70_00585 [Candidatus Aenigmarchaeota archaeon]|nr:hypothetical protein [Candidatus Aenigmarchaeota archaeon]